MDDGRWKIEGKRDFGSRFLLSLRRAGRGLVADLLAPVEGALQHLRRIAAELDPQGPLPSSDEGDRRAIGASLGPVREAVPARGAVGIRREDPALAIHDRL